MGDRSNGDLLCCRVELMQHGEEVAGGFVQVS